MKRIKMRGACAITIYKNSRKGRMRGRKAKIEDTSNFSRGNLFHALYFEPHVQPSLPVQLGHALVLNLYAILVSSQY